MHYPYGQSAADQAGRSMAHQQPENLEPRRLTTARVPFGMTITLPVVALETG
jgi:hypothetical protein